VAEDANADAKRHVLTLFVELMDDVEGSALLRRSTDKTIAILFRFMLPLELVVARRVSKSFAFIPASWFVTAGIALPKPPESKLELKAPVSTDLISCNAIVVDMLARYKLAFLSDMPDAIAAGGYGRVFLLRSTETKRESESYVLKQSIEMDAESRREKRLLAHLQATVPKCVPILYDTVTCKDESVVLLLERLGETLEDVRTKRQDAEIKRLAHVRAHTTSSDMKRLDPTQKRTAESTWLSTSEIQDIVNVVRRISAPDGTGGDVCHLDVHAGNILQRYDGRGWKVIDFGLAFKWSDLVEDNDPVNRMARRLWKRDVPVAGKLLFPNATMAAERTAAEYIYAHRDWYGVSRLFAPEGSALEGALSELPPKTIAGILPPQLVQSLAHFEEHWKAFLNHPIFQKQKQKPAAPPRSNVIVDDENARSGFDDD
jgi:hypothetical protein